MVPVFAHTTDIHDLPLVLGKNLEKVLGSAAGFEIILLQSGEGEIHIFAVFCGDGLKTLLDVLAELGLEEAANLKIFSASELLT